MVLALCLGLAPNAASADVLTEDLPEVGAASYAIIDGDTHQVLFGNNYDKSYDPGTLVQMMTAVIIIEEGNLNDSVTVPEIPEAANNGNRLYLRKGEKINLNDLLQGIIIYNANDAAIAAANHLAGSESAFVDEMNAKAQELGMERHDVRIVLRFCRRPRLRRRAIWRSSLRMHPACRNMWSWRSSQRWIGTAK